MASSLLTLGKLKLHRQTLQLAFSKSFNSPLTSFCKLDNEPYSFSNPSTQRKVRVFSSQVLSQNATLATCLETKRNFENVIFSPPFLWRRNERGMKMHAGEKGNLWRTRNVAIEAVDAVHQLKRAKGDEEKEEAVIALKVARLLKVDTLLVLDELWRQENWRLALRIFRHVQKEVWYRPERALYAKMITCLGKSRQTDVASDLFREMQEVDGLQPTASTYTALLGAYCRGGDYKRGLEIFAEMKQHGVTQIDMALNILIKTCETHGAVKEAEELKKEKENLLMLKPPKTERNKTITRRF